MTKQIEGLVASLRERAKNPDSFFGSQEELLLNEAADYIESTRYGVVDEAGMRKHALRFVPLSQQDIMRGDGTSQGDNTEMLKIYPHQIMEMLRSLSAMRRVSKTDEGK